MINVRAGRHPGRSSVEQIWQDSGIDDGHSSLELKAPVGVDVFLDVPPFVNKFVLHCLTLGGAPL